MTETCFVLGMIGICATALFWFKHQLKHNQGLRSCVQEGWHFHPNCATSLSFFMANASYACFYLENGLAAAGFYIVAAYLDGADGALARARDVADSKKGQFMDALNDKLRYLFPLVYYADVGILQMPMVLFFVVVDFAGQFLIRPAIMLVNRIFSTSIPIASNNFGKVKTSMTDHLVVYCFLLQRGAPLPDVTAQVMLIVMALAVCSIVFKFFSFGEEKERVDKVDRLERGMRP